MIFLTINLAPGIVIYRFFFFANCHVLLPEGIQIGLNWILIRVIWSLFPAWFCFFMISTSPHRSAPRRRYMSNMGWFSAMAGGKGGDSWLCQSRGDPNLRLTCMEEPKCPLWGSMWNLVEVIVVLIPEKLNGLPRGWLRIITTNWWVKWVICLSRYTTYYSHCRTGTWMSYNN